MAKTNFEIALKNPKVLRCSCDSTHDNSNKQRAIRMGSYCACSLIDMKGTGKAKIKKFHAVAVTVSSKKKR